MKMLNLSAKNTIFFFQISILTQNPYFLGAKIQTFWMILWFLSMFNILILVVLKVKIELMDLKLILVPVCATPVDMQVAYFFTAV